MMYSGNGDHYGDLSDLDETVERCVKALEAHRDKFDFIAAMGMSGALVAAPVSLALDMPLVIVRKTSDASHWGARRIVGKAARTGQRYVWIDDFVSSGATEGEVRDQLRKTGARYAGRCLYASDPAYMLDWASEAAPEESQPRRLRFGEPAEEIDSYRGSPWCSITGDADCALCAEFNAQVSA